MQRWYLYLGHIVRVNRVHITCNEGSLSPFVYVRLIDKS